MSDKDLSARVAAKSLTVSQVVARYAAEKHKLVTKDARLTWSDGGIYTLEELPEKGKKKLKVFTYDSSFYLISGWRWKSADWAMPANIMQQAKLSASDSFESIKSKLDKAHDAAWDKIKESNPDENFAKSFGDTKKWQEDSVHFLLVTPEHATPYVAKGKDFEIQVKWEGFTAYSTNSTMQHEGDHQPHYSSISPKSPGAARKFYKLLKEDPTALKSVMWNDFGAWLGKNGVAYDMSHSQW